MDLYIDIENVESIINNRNHQLYPAILQTMRKQLNIFFNFKKEEMLRNEGLMAWFKSFTEGVGKTSKHTFNEVKFPQRHLKSNSYIGFDKIQLSSMYLIHDERIQVLKNSGAILVGSPGEEIQIFSQIFFLHEDYKFDKKMKIGGDEFNNWKDLEKYSTSVLDILFIDSYILSDVSRLDSNIFPLINALVSKSKCKLNIVLYVNFDSVSIDFPIFRKKIQSEVEKTTGVKPNVTLIKVRDQRGFRSKAEHDRTIVTNYLRIYSGDTFNYFNSDGGVGTKGREIHFSSFGDSENHKLALELIDDIQNNINDLSVNAIEGDKKSNFLTFK